ncbi:MAG: hypothetical protein NT067_06175 [Candidatus Diapherotrites archaeon]|nr:hypothetical protein [Candidatus Diapherotrites archaeon]
MPLARRKPNYPMVRRTVLDKATGRRVVVPGSERKTVRQQVEEWPRIARYEMQWGKEFGKPLVPTVSEAERTMDSVGNEKTHEYAKQFKIGIHTHPLTLFRQRRGRGLLTHGDLFNFIDAVKTGRAESEVIASLSLSGKVMGYTVVSLKGVSKPIDQISREVSELISSPVFYYFFPGGFDMPPIDSSPRLVKAYYNGLKKIGFRFKHFSMPGYYFDKRNGRFRRKNIARKAVEALALKKRKSGKRKRQAPPDSFD